MGCRATLSHFGRKSDPVLSDLFINDKGQPRDKVSLSKRLNVCRLHSVPISKPLPSAAQGVHKQHCVGTYPWPKSVSSLIPHVVASPLEHHRLNAWIKIWGRGKNGKVTKYTGKKVQ